MAQRLDDSSVEEEMIPAVHGAYYYLAVGDPTQPWRMAIFDSSKGKWRAIDMQELQALAHQMNIA